ncbi:MAG: hypothetical protein AAFV62_02980, partial [Pseudomonadota bacterium]
MSPFGRHLARTLAAIAVLIAGTLLHTSPALAETWAARLNPGMTFSVPPPEGRATSSNIVFRATLPVAIGPDGAVYTDVPPNAWAARQNQLSDRMTIAAKTDAAGNLIWSTEASVGTVAHLPLLQDTSRETQLARAKLINAIAVSQIILGGDDSLYVVGLYGGEVVIGGTRLPKPQRPSILGIANGFVAKLDAATGAVRWVTTGESADGALSGFASFWMTAALAPDGGLGMHVLGSSSASSAEDFGKFNVAAVAKLSSKGIWTWAQPLDDAARTHAVAVGPDGSVYVTTRHPEPKSEAAFQEAKKRRPLDHEAPKLMTLRAFGSSGEPRWATSLETKPPEMAGRASSERGLQAFPQADGSVELIGYFVAGATLPYEAAFFDRDKRLGPNTALAARTLYRLQIDRTGRWRSARTIAATPPTSERGVEAPITKLASLLALPDGSLIGTRPFPRLKNRIRPIIFDGQKYTPRARGDALIVRVGPDGQTQWVQQLYSGDQQRGQTRVRTLARDPVTGDLVATALLRRGRDGKPLSLNGERVPDAEVPASHRDFPKETRERADAVFQRIAQGSGVPVALRLNGESGTLESRRRISTTALDKNGQVFHSDERWANTGTVRVAPPPKPDTADGPAQHCVGFTGTGAAPAQGYDCEVALAGTGAAKIVWRFEPAAVWPVGQALTPPSNALRDGDLIAPPTFEPEEAFYWSAAEGALYPIKAGAGRVRWAVSADGEQRRLSAGVAQWPSNPTLHTAGAPVPLTGAADEAGDDYQFVKLLHAGPGAKVSQSAEGLPIFRNDTGEGWSVLLYLPAATEEAGRQGPLIDVVRTVDGQRLIDDPRAFLEPTALRFQSNACTVGTALLPPEGAETAGPFVLDTRAAYDATGPERGGYDRTTRSGPVVPVNAADTPLTVVWYRRAASGIPWPSHPVRYACAWPEDAPVLALSAEFGSGPLVGPEFAQTEIYAQNAPGRPGFNPNDEHAFVANLLRDGATVPHLFAARYEEGARSGSEPYVILKHADADGERWRHRVYRVAPETPEHPSQALTGDVASLAPRPYPLRYLGGECGETAEIAMADAGSTSPAPLHRDRKGLLWAQAEGRAAIAWFYRAPETDDASTGFWIDPDLSAEAECLPWLDRHAGTPGVPMPTEVALSWPEEAPSLAIGSRLSEAIAGVPSIADRPSVTLLVDQTGGARLFDLATAAEAPMPAGMPDDVPAELVGDGLLRLLDLPPHLSNRVRAVETPTGWTLRFIAETRDDGAVLLNVMSEAERDILAAQSTDEGYKAAVEALFEASRAVLDKRTVRAGRALLSTGLAEREGWVTLALNDAADLRDDDGLVSLVALRLVCGPDTSALRFLPPREVFEERYAIRHDGDFGGEPERAQFIWRFGAPTEADPSRHIPLGPKAGQSGARTVVIDATLGETGPSPLGDVGFFGQAVLPESPCAPPAGWAGSPGARGETALVAEGWITRAIRGMSPFVAKLERFEIDPANAAADLLTLAGNRFSGPVGFDGDPAKLEGIGAIPAFETVLRRGLSLWREGDDSVLNALLTASMRTAELYAMLGDEAADDAADPLLSFDAAAVGPGDAGVYAGHVFAGVAPSLIDEELALLRGLPKRQDGPPHNKLPWVIASNPLYAVHYNIEDKTGPAGPDLEDAKRLFPQGHGDAWGQYLSAVGTLRRLIGHPNFRWDSREQAIVVDGAAVMSDSLLDVRFARIAATKASTGADIVALTHRSAYSSSPRDALLGYPDADDPARAWGVADWSRRAGQAAYFDWALGASLGAQGDRTVRSPAGLARDAALDEIAASFRAIEAEMERADQGLNPLGLDKNTVSFDFNPRLTDASIGKTHFDQVHERAAEAVSNAQLAYDAVKDLAAQLRQEQNSVEELERDAGDRDLELVNRLIEVFGTPYTADIGGSNGAYKAGYDGPDIFHYEYVEPTPLLRRLRQGGETVSVTFRDDLDLVRRKRGRNETASLSGGQRTVPFEIDASGLGLMRPDSFATSERDTIGDAQVLRRDALEAYGRFFEALEEYKATLANTRQKTELLQKTIDSATLTQETRENANALLAGISANILAANASESALRVAASAVTRKARAGAEALPTTVGTANDPFAPARAKILAAGSVISEKLSTVAEVYANIELAGQLARELVETQTLLKTLEIEAKLSIERETEEVLFLLRQEPARRANVLTLYEGAIAAQTRYEATVGRGLRLLRELVRHRRETTSRVIDSRLRNKAFRTLRRTAVRQYRERFDLAAQHVYLAARALDYETNWLGWDRYNAGRFLDSIVRERQLGLVRERVALGDIGLAGKLATLKTTFDRLRPNLGLERSEATHDKLSLRWELFRIPNGPRSAGDANATETQKANEARWRETLERYWVEDLRQDARFLACCKDIVGAGPQPALVIPFATTVRPGRNLFGRPAGPGDTTLDAAKFVTKIRSLTVMLEGYRRLPLVKSPYVYLAPVGRHEMRHPRDGTLRLWRVTEQTLPVPQPLTAADLTRDKLLTNRSLEAS